MQIHGGDIYQNDVELDYSANINPFGMPERVKEEAIRGVYDSIHYPDMRCGKLTTAIAKKEGVKLIEYFPNYDKYGKGVPLERNKLIVDECDCVLAFWDGTSRGTKFTLDYAKEKNKPIKIIQI